MKLQRMESFYGVGICFCILVSLATADTGYFWHITDFHWDFSYWSGQLSCNGMNISEPGVFGNQWCDAPWRLVEESIKGIKNLKSDVDFILWTGDTVPHVASSNLSTDINTELVRNVTQLLKSEFPNKKIYATFGNHDYYPSGLFPPHGNEIYNASYLIWKEWINETTQEEAFLKGGYYTDLANPKIRIVALNSNMYYTKDTVTSNIEDPADQFKWMETVLLHARETSEKVILTGHVPPGYTTPRGVLWMTKTFNQKFIDIISSYADVIVAMHFGHEHHDSFRLFYDSAGTPVVSLFVAPSVTPWRYQLANGEVEPAHNPGVRLVSYDRQTGKQLDLTQYYVDLNAANRAGTLHWVLGYNATSLYGIPDISPRSMDQVVGKMTSSNDVNFKAYMNWYNTNANTSNEWPCDESCYKSVICGFKYLKQEPFQQCLSAVNGSSSMHIFCSSPLLLSIALIFFCKQYL